MSIRHKGLPLEVYPHKKDIYQGAGPLGEVIFTPMKEYYWWLKGCGYSNKTP